MRGNAFSGNNLDNIPILNWMIAPHLLSLKACGRSPDASIATVSSKILMDLSRDINDSGIWLHSQRLLFNILAMPQVDTNQSGEFPDGFFEQFQALIV